MQFQINSRRENRLKDAWIIKISVLRKVLANNFTLSDAIDNTSGPLNRGSIADLLLLRTVLAIHQKSWEPSFWEVMDCLVLLAYASLAASRTLLQWLSACLNFTLDSEDLFCWYKWKGDFYELWQQHKQLKTMEMSEAWPDIYNEGFVHQFQPEPIHKIH